MLRRVSYSLIALVFIFVMSLPIIAFVLAARGELMVGNEAGSNLRLFMVNTDEAEGIGIQHVRRSGDDNSNCLQGSVRYLLWQGDASEQAADYCTCFSQQSDSSKYSDAVMTSGRCGDQ